MGQVDHAGHLATLSELPGPPDVLVDAQRLHPGKAARVVGVPARLGLERVPQRVPVQPEPTGERVHGRVVLGEGVGSPHFAPTTTITKPHVDTFLSASGKSGFTERLIVSTSDR